MAGWAGSVGCCVSCVVWETSACLRQGAVPDPHRALMTASYKASSGALAFNVLQPLGFSADWL